MASYIMLLNWTEQGVAKIKASSKRLDAGRKAFKKLGCELKDAYLTMGPYDLICVLDAPDAETALSWRQDLQAVMRALDELPERTREIFRLHKLGGMPQAEVARRFDLSLSAVEKHLGRALKHLMLLKRARNLN